MSLLQRQPYQESTFQLLQPLSSRPRKTTCVTADHVPPNNFPIYRAIFWFYCAINVIYRAIKKIWLSSFGPPYSDTETSRALCERPAWSHANERLDDALLLKRAGVTTSRATSGDRKNDPNMSGQRWNNFHISYIDRSFVVSGNNRVVKPKCKQFTSLNKMLSNSKVLIVHISFTALINNEGIGGIRKVPRKIKCTFCSCRKQSCCKPNRPFR